jgi:carboxymethylenebutenolidase
MQTILLMPGSTLGCSLYYSATDDEVMRSPGRDRRIALYEARFRDWAKTVSEIAGFALAQKASSGRVGLLGLSNGGFLAVGTAAVDPRIAALVVFYGGIPGPVRDEITRLPPLLALHGDGDHIIPIGEGRALVDRANALEGQAELIAYPRADHGFDFDPNSHIANDARSRAIAFLRRQLGAD